MERVMVSLLLVVSSLSISCTDDDYLESCKDYKCYKSGVCYQTYGRRYDLRRNCIVGVQEINCLESIELNILNDDTVYFAMGPGGQDGRLLGATKLSAERR
jgi:hypothetical protein